MKRDAENTPSRSRTRKKTTALSTPAPAPEPEAVSDLAETASDLAETAPAEDSKNVGPLEGSLSVAAGVLLLIAALFPRSFKQLFLLAIGGGLVFRGVKNKCSVYAALGIDTAKEPLLKQINEKFLAPATKD